MADAGSGEFREMLWEDRSASAPLSPLRHGTGPSSWSRLRVSIVLELTVVSSCRLPLPSNALDLSATKPSRCSYRARVLTGVGVAFWWTVCSTPGMSDTGDNGVGGRPRRYRLSYVQCRPLSAHVAHGLAPEHRAFFACRLLARQPRPVCQRHTCFANIASPGRFGGTTSMLSFRVAVTLCGG
jgi:hypothetical protein